MKLNAAKGLEISTAGRPTSERSPSWWLWPHVVSLDAPLVALVWQHWWAQAAGVRLAWYYDAILTLGVWMIYLADRLADTREGVPAPPLTARHTFSGRYRNSLRPLLLAVGLALAILTPTTLAARQFAGGLGLLAVAGSYFWLIHRPRPASRIVFVPKEIFVGLIFASGTLFFVVERLDSAHWPLLLGGAFFAVLCFFNCALITRWEANVADREDPASLQNAFPWLNARLGSGCLGLAIMAGMAAVLGATSLLPIAMSALALAWLDRRRAALSADALRVLADLALLTPLLCGTAVAR